MEQKKILQRQVREQLRDIIANSRGPWNVLFLEGARQVGKTTLMNDVLSEFKDVFAVNLEEQPVLRNKIDLCQTFQEFRDFIATELGLPMERDFILFIDEAQESSQLSAFVRFMKEEWLNAKVILSGSSMKKFFRPSQRVPVGRFTRLVVRPFNFCEYLRATGKGAYADLISNFSMGKASFGLSMHQSLLSEIDRYMLLGGLPEVVLNESHQIESKDMLQQIFLQQEEDFLRKESGVDNFYFREAIKTTAFNLGSSSSYSQLDCSTEKSKKLFHTLEEWHLIHKVEQASFAATTRFHPKRYVYDLGIAQYLRNTPFPTFSVLNTKNIALRSNLGGVFENLVFNSLISDSLMAPNILSWRQGAQNQVEIDFIWKTSTLNENTVPIEVKASLKSSRRAFTAIVNYLQVTSQSIGITVSAAPLEVYKEGNLTLVNLPIYLCSSGNIERIVQALGG